MKPDNHDDRVICPTCGKRMVPRLITYQGIVERTVCPFCAQTYQDFTPPEGPSFLRRLVIVVIGSWFAVRIVLPLMIWLGNWLADLFR